MDEATLAEIRAVLLRSTRSICPAWLRDQVEDIVQAAMMRVLAIAGRGEEDRVRSSSYLWTVAHSATMDEIRRARRRQRETAMDATDLDQLAETAPAADPGPDRLARGSQIGRAIRDCLRTLVEPRRHVVTLHLLGYGLTEAAGVLHQDRKRVDNLLYRGLADMRRCLGDKEMTP